MADVAIVQAISIIPEALDRLAAVRESTLL